MQPVFCERVWQWWNRFYYSVLPYQVQWWIKHRTRGVHRRLQDRSSNNLPYMLQSCLAILFAISKLICIPFSGTAQNKPKIWSVRRMISCDLKSSPSFANWRGNVELWDFFTCLSFTLSNESLKLLLFWEISVSQVDFILKQ